MRNAEQWQPSRFVPGRRGYRPSPDGDRLAPTSRFVAGVQIRAYEALLREHVRGRLLDLGCGAVPYFGLYRDRIDGCVCVDWPRSAYASPHLDLHADLNAALPLADATMDTVLLTDVLEHVARPGPLVREIARVLRPDGKLIATVPFLYRLHEEPHDYYRYTEHALRRFCDEAGLDVVVLEPYGGLPEVFGDLVNKSVVFSRIVAGGLLRLARALTALGPVRRISRRSARTFPLGYGLVARRCLK
ncbi:MAG: methyltransferase domain-containing protein [Planctomycetota bacterium]|jgi:SAM-dependent methyltransferase